MSATMKKEYKNKTKTEYNSVKKGEWQQERYFLSCYMKDLTHYRMPNLTWKECKENIDYLCRDDSFYSNLKPSEDFSEHEILKRTIKELRVFKEDELDEFATEYNEETDEFDKKKAIGIDGIEIYLTKRLEKFGKLYYQSHRDYLLGIIPEDYDSNNTIQRLRVENQRSKTIRRNSERKKRERWF